MSDYSVIPRKTSISMVTPVIPLNFVYPGLSLAQILSIARAYWRLSLFIVLLVVSLTALAMTLWPRTYTATATLLVNYEVNDPLNEKELPAGQVGSYIATQVELMQIPEVMLAVVDRLRLTQNKYYVQGYTSDSGTLREWVANILHKNLTIYQGQQGSQLIYVTYSANKAMHAAQVANAVTETYLASSLVRSIKSQLSGQEARLTKLNITFASHHPDVVELRSQINATRISLAGMSNSSAMGAGSSSQQDPPLTEYKFPSGGHYTNVNFVSRAIAPIKASKPKLLTGFLLGSIAAGVLGFGIPISCELFNRRVRCRDDLERHHGIPVLVEFGALPLQAATLPMRKSV